MSNRELMMLKEYLELGGMPLLIENMDIKSYEDAVVLDANCSRELLNGHYDGLDYVAPDWFKKLVNKGSEKILIINNINSVEKNEQRKFMEILKYKKVSTFLLPEDVRIVVTCFDLKNKPIDEDVYSLLVHI